MGMVWVIRGKRWLMLFAACALVLVAAAQAAPGKPDPQSAPKRTSRSAALPSSTPSKTLLDTAIVRRLYLDGEFDEAIDKVETSLRYGSGHTHVDSVFAFKHLGVMYTARYETREKGKLYMLRLLEVEPTARILDMYASDMIYMIFKNIKDEFDASQGRFDPSNGTASPHQPGPGRKGDPGDKGDKSDKSDKGRKDDMGDNDTQAAKAKSGGSGVGYWLGAAGLAVAAGVATWYAFSDEPKTQVNRHAP
jgi:hypothetical protein